MSFEIRVCEPSNVLALDWSGANIYRDHFANQFARQQAGDATIFIALADDHLVGRVIADFEYGEPDEMWVLGLEVREGHRRQGIATSLMQVAEQEARQKKAERLLLTVAKSNHVAQQLYTNLGYENVGEDTSPGLKDKQGRYLAAPEPRWILERKLG